MAGWQRSATRPPTISIAYVVVLVMIHGAAALRSLVPVMSSANVTNSPPQLLEVVGSAVHLIAAFSSGLFASSDVPGAFVTTDLTLRHRHHAVVHPLMVDRCTVPFREAVRGPACNSVAVRNCAPPTASFALIPEQRKCQQYTVCDSRNAVAFALYLERGVWPFSVCCEAERSDIVSGAGEENYGGVSATHRAWGQLALLMWSLCSSQ